MLSLTKFSKLHTKASALIVLTITMIAIIAFLLLQSRMMIQGLSNENKTLTKSLASTSAELTALKNQDQVKINQQNTKEIQNINTTYKKAIATYEKLLDLKLVLKNTGKYDDILAEALNQLSEKNYSSADATLTLLTSQIQTEQDKLAPPTAGSALANAPVNNAPPSSGYSGQRVKTELGEFGVSIVSADLGSTRVIVDTASDGDCRDNCPVLSLGDYVSRNGAFAGINGSYFCPASYPSCAGKARSSDWGRDTSVDGVLANQPLVLSGGNIAFGGDGDPKKGSRGSRSFVGNKGNIVYIGVVHNATVAEVGYVLKAIGLENGLNLDSGGSTALWSGGYKAGPGRAIPNAILFVRK